MSLKIVMAVFPQKDIFFGTLCILLEKMDEDPENCCKLDGLRHEQQEAQHGGGGGGDDGAIPHPNLTLACKTI